jgi:hypothetical protein
MIPCPGAGFTVAWEVCRTAARVRAGSSLGGNSIPLTLTPAGPVAQHNRSAVCRLCYRMGLLLRPGPS